MVRLVLFLVVRLCTSVRVFWESVRVEYDFVLGRTGRGVGERCREGIVGYGL